jgi:hypothetical protein
MTGNPDDERLESYLRQFRPQNPRPLPGKLRLAWTRHRASLAGAAAAMILVAASVIFFPKPPGTRSTAISTRRVAAQAVTFGQLRRFADDPAGLDAHLASLSPQVLPDVRHVGGVLNKLAQETQ